MTQQSSPEQHAAYRAGLCIDCKTEPYAAGHPRCTACHTTYTQNGYQR